LEGGVHGAAGPLIPTRPCRSVASSRTTTTRPEVAESCITLNSFSHPCLDKYDAGGVDQLKARIEATAPKVGAVLAGI
jgi:hypothetical protein